LLSQGGADQCLDAGDIREVFRTNTQAHGLASNTTAQELLGGMGRSSFNGKSPAATYAFPQSLSICRLVVCPVARSVPRLLAAG
jgi:hypothetical protein